MNLQTLQALKDELTLDPLSRGYSAMSDEQAAASLNAPGRDVDRDSITGGEIAASVVFTELNALQAAQQNYVRALFACASIPLTTNFKQQIGGLFAQNTATRANLLALNRRGGSRAEELGLGHVSPSDVADAKRLT